MFGMHTSCPLQIQKWDPAFAEYIAELDKTKPVIITGDLNCAHQAIDIHSPRTNKKSPGFTEVVIVHSNQAAVESCYKRIPF